MISDQTRRQKSREVSSRYLSTTVAPPSPPLGFNHNNLTLTSPNHHNPKPKQKHKHTGFIRGLWPSSASKNDLKRSQNTPVLSKQKSCTEFRHSEKLRNTRNSLKENNTPVFGNWSMRFTGKLGRPSMSSMNSSNIFDSDPSNSILPGRLSVDENALRRRSDFFSDNSEVNSEANSEASDVSSPYTTGRNSLASYMAPTLSSRKHAVDVPRCISPSISMHNSPKGSKVKRTMRRANSLSKTSLEMEWESSPSRSLGSPLFSSSKPPTSSSSAKGKKNLLHIGLDLIKGRKGGSKLQSPLGSDAGTNVENVHRLRLLQNSLMQWRHVNARAENVHESLAAQSEKTLFCGIESVAKLRELALQKRMQVQKEKQEVKLNLILHSQIQMLEAWGDIERRHMLDVSVIKDYLHAVVCMIPLIEGAKVDLESATMAFEDTSHMVATIQSMLSSVSPTAHETMVTLSELADVVTQEKLLLEDCFEHLEIISTLEIQERNLRCDIITMDSSDEQQQQKEQMFM